MTFFATAGSKVFIGGSIYAGGQQDLALADFASQTWVEIGGLDTIGSLGDTATAIVHQAIGQARDLTLKGTRSAGTMELSAAIDYRDPGQIKLLAAEKTAHNYAFKVQFNDAPAPAALIVTISVASPGVVTWADHGLEPGDKVVFSTTGALPTGLTAGTTYYVKTVPDEDTFTLTATPGGTVINTSSSQSGVHTATTIPTPSERLMAGLVMSAAEALDQANSVMKLTASVTINSNIIRVNATP